MSGTLHQSSPCKVNLLLNILGKRADGFHELETVMLPVALCDDLILKRAGHGITFTCSEPALPTDSRNLVVRAAGQFLARAGISDGVSIHLEKRIPMAAGLGGGSGNAANTLLALNELFDYPLHAPDLQTLAAGLGSDVPFFLQSGPALATGRGEHVKALDPFNALRGHWLFLVHPGFGISTPWAYQQLANFPEALNGQAGRANRLVDALQQGDLNAAKTDFYNSLEAPALRKYPILRLYQEFLREQGAWVSLMSGSGSTTFALFESEAIGRRMLPQFKTEFGGKCWTALVALEG